MSVPSVAVAEAEAKAEGLQQQNSKLQARVAGLQTMLQQQQQQLRRLEPESGMFEFARTLTDGLQQLVGGSDTTAAPHEVAAAMRVQLWWKLIWKHRRSAAAVHVQCMIRSSYRTVRFRQWRAAVCIQKRARGKAVRRQLVRVKWAEV